MVLHTERESQFQITEWKLLSPTLQIWLCLWYIEIPARRQFQNGHLFSLKYVAGLQLIFSGLISPPCQLCNVTGWTAWKKAKTYIKQEEAAPTEKNSSDKLMESCRLQANPEVSAALVSGFYKTANGIFPLDFQIIAKNKLCCNKS